MFYSILIFILVTLNGIFHFYILQVSIPCHKLSWQALQLAPWFDDLSRQLNSKDGREYTDWLVDP